MHELVLDGPGMNALGSAMMNHILSELETAGGAPVLLRGEGRALSAGLDLKEVAGLDPAGLRTYLELLERMTAALFDYPGPIVAAITGHAIAGGCVLAQCCDIRIASDNPKIRIGLNELTLGVHLPPVVMATMSWRIPVAHRSVVLLEAGLHSPTEALRLGLVDAIVADAEAEAWARLEHLANVPPIVFGPTKRALRHGVTAVSDEANRHFFEEDLPSSWASADLRQRIAAIFSRKR